MNLHQQLPSSRRYFDLHFGNQFLGFKIVEIDISNKVTYRCCTVYCMDSTQHSHHCTNYLLFYGTGRNNFEAGNIHYKVHFKGWALKIKTFLGPEMSTSTASAIWPERSRFSGPNPHSGPSNGYASLKIITCKSKRQYKKG